MNKRTQLHWHNNILAFLVYPSDALTNKGEEEASINKSKSESSTLSVNTILCCVTKLSQNMWFGLNEAQIASYNLLSICLVTDYSLGIVCGAREVES